MDEVNYFVLNICLLATEESKNLSHQSLEIKSIKVKIYIITVTIHLISYPEGLFNFSAKI